MRSQYIPIANVVSTVPYQKEIAPDFLNASYIPAIFQLPTSKTIVLSAKYVGYPDLLSYDVYGTVDYWWILCMMNGIVDIYTDMTAGMTWNIPAMADIQGMLSQGIRGALSSIGSSVVI